jgi:hypothetical protein
MNDTRAATPTAMDAVNDIHAHHDVVITLAQLAELIDGSIGYEKHMIVLLNVIETEIRAADASMKALTEKICGCLDKEVQP